jgi:acyl-coenzyme A synthetase/AMP-(fatty) acid ligase
MYPLAITSIICAGGVYSPCGAGLARDDAVYTYKLVKPKAVICSEKLYEECKVISDAAGVPRKNIFIMSSKPGHHDIVNAETKSSLKLSAPRQWEHYTEFPQLNETIMIFFTSGTSGFPKYVACP